MMFHEKRFGAPAALALLLALPGCISFGGKPPAELLSLDAAHKVAPGTTRSVAAGTTITVADPDAPKMLDTVRVPVRITPTSLAYVTKVQWADTPRHLFQKLLSETIAATTGRQVLDSRQAGFDPGTRLTGQLQFFGLDGDRLEAVAIYDAALARGSDRVETRRFEARVPVAAATSAAVAPALNQAANQVAADVAKWIGG